METASNQIAQDRSPKLLNTGITANAVFTSLSALILILFSGPIAKYMGLSNPQILAAVGVVLALYVPFLVWTARKFPVPRALAWAIIELDLLWVAGSAVLIFTEFAGLTSGGKWVLAIVADIVAAFAVVQYIGLRKQSPSK